MSRFGPALELWITDPEAAVLERPGVVWSVSGLGASDRDELLRRGDHGDGLETEIARGARDASILKVCLVEGRPVSLRAWRGLMSDHQVFWAKRPDGELLVADHFRNIVSRLPTAEREPGEEAVVEHFLYRQVLGRLTYCRNVQRLGHGEQLRIDVGSGAVEAKVFDRIEDTSEARPLRAYVDRIDRALASVLEPLRGEEGVANQFSGGVDSTLIQTYLGADVPALTLVPDTPEFGRETTYATRAAALLGLPLERHAVAEADYLAQLEGTIDQMGLPPIHEGTILDAEAYGFGDRLGFRKYVVGEHGDSIFGLGGRRARIAWWLRSPLARGLLRLAVPRLPGELRERLAGLDEVAEQLRRDPASPLGHPAQRNLYTDPELAEAIFGPERVRDRLVANWDYMVGRVVLAAPANDLFLRHLEAARWIGALDDVILPQRHLAQAKGKAVVSPFAAQEVVASALAVPIGQRYLRGLQDKYLLKRLLKRRLPGYPVNQRKLSTELPFARYYTDGPLAEVWERYALPDFIYGRLRGRIVEEPSWVTWNAITWAIWSARVARNPELEGIPTSRRLAWPLGAAAGEARGRTRKTSRLG
jgi:asparagine synthase (glutamine-hydrolysing)